MEDSLIGGIIGAVITAAIAYIGHLWQKRYNYAHLFAQTVSQSRNIWLNEMREYLSTMIAEARILWNSEFSSNESNTMKKYEYIEKYHKVRNQIVLRLNLSEPLHKGLHDNIVALDKWLIELDKNRTLPNNNVNVFKDKNNGYFESIMENIEQISMKILKEEWEKVKLEAKGKGE